MKGSSRSVRCALIMVSLGATLPLDAQSGAAPTQGIGQGAPVARADTSTIAPLRRLVTLDFKDARLEAVLDEIDRQAKVGLQYTPRTVPVDKRVNIRVTGATVSAALGEVLRGTGVEAVSTEAGEVILVKRSTSVTDNDETVQVAAGIVWGRVTDSASGEPVANVVVSVKGTAIRASTAEGGSYQLNGVPSGRQIIVTRLLGYLSLEAEVTVADDRRARADFALRHSLTRLQEVVTTATGRQRRLELGNDITVLNADSIVRTMPITSVTDLLEGRVPGLIVQRTSGAPGDPARIRLRGASSPRLSNDPILIVDGVRVYSDQSGERGENMAYPPGSGTRYATPSPLDYIDPNSIETIEVVKGPSAATLYGQDAANGVILITTKKGRAGPTRWGVSAERGMTKMAGSYPDLLLRWGHPLAENTPVFCPLNNSYISGNLTGLPCMADSVVSFQLLNDPDLTVLDRGSRTATSLSVSGGSAALTYALTGSHQDQVGLVALPRYEIDRYQAERGTGLPDWMRRPQNFTQWGGTSRLSAQLGTTAEVSLTANLSRSRQQRSKLEQQLGVLMGTYLDRSGGRYYRQHGPTIASLGRIKEITTQILDDYYERATTAATQFTNGVNAGWRPRSWLTTSVDAGLNVVQRADEIFLPRGFAASFDSSGRVALGHGTSVLRTVNLRARAGVPVGRGFQFQFATGVNYTGQSVDDLNGSVRGLQEGSESPNAALEIGSLSQRRIDNATFGWYVEPSINHKRLWLSTGVRLDGGNTFGTQLKLPSFPKLQFSYLISDEPFFPFKGMFQVLRLRTAYGQAGRQPGPTDRLRLYGLRTPFLVDGQLVDGVELDHLGNTKLEPERTTEFEGGFDTDLLGDRLSVSFTGWRKTTTDALLGVPLAPSVYGDGVTMLRNIGVVRNTGLDGSVGAQLLRTDRLTWGVQLSLAQTRNEVVRLGPGVEPFYTSSEGLTGIRVAPGYPLFGRWTKPIIGYADADGNGVLEAHEVLLGDTAVYMGGTLPNFTTNISTSISLFRGAIFVGAGFMYEDGMTQQNQVAPLLAAFSHGWNDPETSIDEQAATIQVGEYNRIQTISTLRFNSLSVMYNVPSTVAKRLGAATLTLKVQGTNLGLRTNYRGFDPNVNSRSTGNSVTDAGVLPQPRAWQLGVNASF